MSDPAKMRELMERAKAAAASKDVSSEVWDGEQEGDTLFGTIVGMAHVPSLLNKEKIQLLLTMRRIESTGEAGPQCRFYANTMAEAQIVELAATVGTAICIRFNGRVKGKSAARAPMKSYAITLLS